MQRLIDLEEARQKVWSDIQKLRRQVLSLSSREIKSIPDGISLLMELRKETAEDTTQIQHEYMILAAAEWLIENNHCHSDTKWDWNPRQTGPADEPDLQGTFGKKIVLSAEVTTSPEPKGVLDKRMKHTLTNPGKMRGNLFYFVRTPAMSRRATTKIQKSLPKYFGCTVTNMNSTRSNKFLQRTKKKLRAFLAAEERRYVHFHDLTIVSLMIPLRNEWRSQDLEGNEIQPQRGSIL